MSEQSFIEVPSIKFHRTLSGGSRTKSVRLPQTDRQAGRHNKTNKHFSQLCKCTYKLFILQTINQRLIMYSQKKSMTN